MSKITRGDEVVSVTRLKCDIGAEETEDVQTYVLIFPDGEVSVDLCDKHAVPLEKLREQLPPEAKRSVRRRGRPRAPGPTSYPDKL